MGFESTERGSTSGEKDYKNEKKYFAHERYAFFCYLKRTKQNSAFQIQAKAFFRRELYTVAGVSLFLKVTCPKDRFYRKKAEVYN